MIFLPVILLSFAAPVLAQDAGVRPQPEQTHTPANNPYADRNYRWLTEVWQKKGGAAQPHAANGYDIVAADAWSAIMANMLIKTGVADGATVFDFGCGGGSSCLVLNKMRKNISFYGIDYSQSLIERAKKELPNGTFWTQSITQPLKQQPATKADLVMCSGVFLYLDSPKDVEQSILTMASVAKPGAKILLGDISDSEKKHVADKIRGEVHSKVATKVSSDDSLDHLYLSRSFFSDIANKLGAGIEFIEFADVDPAGSYANGAYRFNAIITLPNAHEPRTQQ